jgi:catalase
VQRTFATARSIEFDAVLLAGVPGAGADALGARDAKAGNPQGVDAEADPRVVMLVAEAFRHGKAIGFWGGADALLTAAGVPTDAAGIASGSGDEVVREVTRLLGSHRAWERFPVSNA